MIIERLVEDETTGSDTTPVDSPKKSKKSNINKPTTSKGGSTKTSATKKATSAGGAKSKTTSTKPISPAEKPTTSKKGKPSVKDMDSADVPQDYIEKEEASGNKTKPTYPPTRQMIDRYRSLKTADEQINFVKTYLLRGTIFKNFFGIRRVIIASCLDHGIDPKKNIFLDFVAELTKTAVKIPNKNDRPKMEYIYNSFKAKKLNLRQPVLKDVLCNPSLYEGRSEKDFKYTVNVFNLLSQPNKAKAYLKNTEVINFDELFEGEGKADLRTSILKPGGASGQPGDTIFNVLERWADNNEYSPEEIAQNKHAEEEEEEKNKKKSPGDGSGGGQSTAVAATSINVTVNVPNANGNIEATEWNYDYFKEELEKVFANKGNYKTSLPNKNDYLNRAFATFVLPNLSPVETENKVYKKSTKDVKDADVSKFGDPHKLDTPIPLKVRTASAELLGVYVFHQFVPLDDSSKSYYKQISNKNLGNLKRSLNKVTPNTDQGVDDHLQRIIDALGTLQEIVHK